MLWGQSGDDNQHQLELPDRLSNVRLRKSELSELDDRLE